MENLIKIDLKYALSNTSKYWKEQENEVFPKGVVILDTDSGSIKLSDGETPLGQLPFIGDDDGEKGPSYTKGEVDSALSLKADKTVVEALDKTVSDNKEELVDSIALKANSADVYTKDEIDGKIASTFHYKGSVDTEAELPKTAEIGDVYNVVSDGSNYAWNGESWDKLSETIDLSPYLLKADAESDYATIESLENVVETINKSIATKADKTEVEASLALKADKTALESEVATLEESIATKADKTALDEAVSEINESIATKADSQSTTNALELKADKSELKDWAEYSSIATEDYPYRKAINLRQNDALISGGVMLAFVNEWGVADFGGSKAHSNINTATTLVEGETKYGVVTINDDAAVLTDKILNNVLVSSGNVKVSDPIVVSVLNKDVYTYEMNVDLGKQDSSIESLRSRLNALEARLSDASKTNVSTVEIVEGQAISENDTTNDIVVNGGNATANIGITAASVELDSVSVSNNARTTLSATSDVSLNNVSYSGKFPKTGGNTITNIKSAKYVSIKDNSYELEGTSYNAIEIGYYDETLTAPKSITIDGLNITGELSNNAISIHKLADNSIVNINNCHFDKVSNVLRLTNSSNAKNVTINITNCSCNEWASDIYAGMIICQDAPKTGDMQDFSTFTINISNFKYKGEKLVAPENISDVCGSQNSSQILYVYRDATGKVESYDSTTYPTLNIM